MCEMKAKNVIFVMHIHTIFVQSILMKKENVVYLCDERT